MIGTRIKAMLINVSTFVPVYVFFLVLAELLT